MENGKEKNVNIEKENYEIMNAIKIIFILLVLLRHFHWYFEFPRIHPMYLGILALVEIFMGYIFFISGFGLTLSQMKNKYKKVDFYKKRLLRIYPLYIVSLVIYVFYVAEIDFKNFLIHVVNLHNFFPEYCHNPKPLWFMGIIFQFYILFPILFKFYMRYKKLMLITSIIIYLIYTGIIFSIEYTSAKALYKDSNLQDVFLLTFLPQFVIGMYVGELFYNNQKEKFEKMLTIGNKLIFLLITVTVAMVLLFDERLLNYGFKYISPLYSIAVTCFCIRFLKYINKSTIQFMSRLSIGVFAVYLFHEFIFSFMSIISKNYIFGLIVVFPFTFLIGTCIQYGYEQILFVPSRRGKNNSMKK